MPHHTEVTGRAATRLRWLALMALGAGCGASSGGFRPRLDGGVVLPDLARADMNGDMAFVPPPPVDLASPQNLDISELPPPATVKMVAGNYFLYGVTSDDKVIATNLDKNNALVAVPVGGNIATTISPGGWSMTIHGRAVFDWEGIDQQTNVGQGNIWTAVGGLKALTNGGASVGGIANVSPDGNWIYYSGNAKIDGTATDLYVARSDTTGSIRFATGGLVDVINDPTACSSFGLFTATNKLLSIVCGQGNVLQVVNPANGQVTRLSGNVGNWMVADPLGRYAAAGDPNHKLSYFPLDGSAPIAVDTGAAPGQAAFLPDGSALIYVTDGGQLKRAAVGNVPAPSTLVQAGVTIIRRSFFQRESQAAISADGKWVVFSGQWDEQTGIGDLYLASTKIAGAPTTLVPDMTGEIFGDPFTQDSRFVLYYSEVAQVGSGLIGSLNDRPLAGGPPTRICTRSWISYGGPGSLVGYNDNYKVGKNYGRADFHFVDPGIPMQVTSVANQAEAEIFPTRDRKTFIFSTTVSPNANGMYSVPAGL